jgi:hypothetical protein
MADQATDEVSRFGFTEEEWKAFRERYRELSDSEPREKQPDGMVFFDWEAERLRKAFEHFKDADPDVCAVLAHMMWYVTDRDYYTGRGR